MSLEIFYLVFYVVSQEIIYLVQHPFLFLNRQLKKKNRNITSCSVRRKSMRFCESYKSRPESINKDSDCAICHCEILVG